MSLAPFLAAILDHWRSRYSVCKQDIYYSHFVVTGERGSSRRKPTLNEVTAAYSHGSKHDGGSAQGEKRIKSEMTLISPGGTGQRGHLACN